MIQALLAEIKIKLIEITMKLWLLQEIIAVLRIRKSKDNSLLDHVEIRLQQNYILCYRRIQRECVAVLGDMK